MLELRDNFSSLSVNRMTSHVTLRAQVRQYTIDFLFDYVSKSLMNPNSAVESVVI
jgi:hypothetical protein